MKRTFGILALAATWAATPASAREEGQGPSAAVLGLPVYLAVDLSSHQVLLQKDADRTFLPASMTKVMTAYLAFELIAQGRLKPEQRLTVRPATAAAWAGRGTGMGLKAGEQITADMLLQGITTVSANDASVVLAEGAAGSVATWTTLMNAEARKLGMTASHFGTPNGWPDGGATRVSAQDMIRLGTALVERHPALYARYFGKRSLTWNGFTGHNHDPVVGVVAGADGIKTGHTREAGYNFLGTAIRDGRRIMIVVGGARSEAQRAEGSRDLLEWSFRETEKLPLFAPRVVIGHALVQGGNLRRIGLVAPHGANLTVPRSARPSITTNIRYRGPLIAPIAKGAEVAQLEVSVQGRIVNRVPLVAAEGAGKAGPFDRLRNGLAGMLP